MLKTNATWVVAIALALAATSACKKKDAPPSAARPGDAATAEPAPAPGAPVAAAPTLPEPLARFKAALDPVLAKPDGVKRARAGCEAKLFELTKAIRNLPAPAGVDAKAWTSATEALSTDALGIDEVCSGDGGGPEEATDAILKDVTEASKHLQAIIALLPK